MLPSILAAAAVLVPPAPIDPAAWVTTKDYPSQSLSRLERGFVLFRLVVTPEGTVASCKTEGSTMLDKTFCRLVPERARFIPATRDGKPAYGIFKSRARYVLPSMSSPSAPAEGDLELTVDRLPEAVGPFPWSQVIVVTDGTGAIAECVPKRRGEAQPEEVAQFLGAITCGELKRAHRAEVVHDAQGRPVDYVSSMSVKFVTASPR